MTMNKKGSFTRRRGEKKVDQKFYEIIEDDTTASASSIFSGHLQKNYEELSKSLLRDHRFLYIDMCDDKGYKVMRECEESDNDEETEQLGSHFISNLDYSSASNSKAIAYIFQRKRQNSKKDQALKMLYDQVRRSRQKVKKYPFLRDKKTQDNEAVQSAIHVYRGMESSMIEKIKQKQEYLQQVAKLKEREDQLYRHYNTIDTHKSKMKAEGSNPAKSKSGKLTSFLPTIPSRTIPNH